MFPNAISLSLQSIPPSAAHLCLTVENFVQKELGRSLGNKKLLVGLSGGVDSTALLLIFSLLAKRNNLTLTAAHLNHAIRPEAKRDQDFCQSLCAHLSIPFFTTTVDVPALCKNGAGLEDAARVARYNFFSSLKPQISYDYLLTGHHLNDLAEDCFMRLLRGSGWPSLAGMPAYTQQRSQLRPLLMQSKERLEQFLLDLNILHVIDATNKEAFTLRNRIRQQILPFFIKENPRFLERIAALWKQASLEKEDIHQMLTPLFKSIAASLPKPESVPPCDSLKHNDDKTTAFPTVVTLSKEQLENLPQSIRLRAYKHVLDTLGPGQVLSATLLKLDRAWLHKKGQALFQFSHGKTAQIDKQSIIFRIN